MDNCPNCGEKSFGNYCSNCGQKRITVPINSGALTSSMLDLIDFNRGFFYTLFSLLVKPGELLNNYLEGKTRKYNNPVRLLSTIITFFVAADVLRSSGTDDITAIDMLPVICILFIYSLSFNKILYRNKFVFVEFLVITLYQVTAIYFILSFFTIFFLSLESFGIFQYSDVLSTSIAGLVSIVFLTVFYYQFNNSSLGWSIIKSFLFLLGIPAIALILRFVRGDFF